MAQSNLIVFQKKFLPVPKEKAPIYTVVHHISGRLRLRLQDLNQKEDYANYLQKLILKTTGIIEIRINLAASCIIIYYSTIKISDTDILYIVDKLIETAQKKYEAEVNLVELSPSKSSAINVFPAFSLFLALIAAPLEIPLWLAGGIIVVSSLPLWQKVKETLGEKGEITVDSLDSLWLSIQLIQGNILAASLGINFFFLAEHLRQTKQQELLQQLTWLEEHELELIHPYINQHLSQRAWLKSINETQLMQQVDTLSSKAILPTLISSGAIALITGDLTRASAILPLDLGVTIRGVTPLLITSSLVSAARQGVYIQDGKTLEQLALLNPTNFQANKKPIEELIREGKLVIINESDGYSLEYSIIKAKETFAHAYQRLTAVTLVNLLTCGFGVIFGLDPIIAVLLNGGSAILAEMYIPENNFNQQTKK